MDGTVGCVMSMNNDHDVQTLLSNYRSAIRQLDSNGFVSGDVYSRLASSTDTIFERLGMPEYGRWANQAIFTVEEVNAR